MSKILSFPLMTDGSVSIAEATSARGSLFDTKDAFIERMAPAAVAAIYFGGFSLAPQDISLSRQALYKLSFLNRHYLQPGGLRVLVDRHTAILSGTVTSPLLALAGEILALQIDGIRMTQNETTAAETPATSFNSIQFLFATDQTLRTGVRISAADGRGVVLEGEVNSEGQKNWAKQLAASRGDEVESRLSLSSTGLVLKPMSEPPQIDDESLQALVLFRLRLDRETESLGIKVKAGRGVVVLQGKVRTEALRRRVENLARSTVGVRELRSSLSIVG